MSDILKECALALGLFVGLHFMSALLNLSVIDTLMGCVCYLWACKILKR